jgi:S-adenosylmethionine/arginine decarboxylase-like enzyme
MMSKYWGYHMMLDCAACDRSKIMDKQNVINFTKELVKRIDMTAHGEPIVEYFAEHDINKAGFSMLQLIVTSNLSAHFIDSSGDAYFDIFSCKIFDQQTVIDTITEFFAPEHISHKFMARDARAHEVAEQDFNPADHDD